MRLEFSGPVLESLYGKRHFFPGERSRNSKRIVGMTAALAEGFIFEDSNQKVKFTGLAYILAQL
jgi:hypothetical protein